ncbi:MAG: PEP-CTERM sorting domain-containing protein [Burkholderiales bacterium]|nr:MAG: PEP-CTERM sorting domain-containing protein [Burkholderiales bacterium]
MKFTKTLAAAAVLAAISTPALANIKGVADGTSEIFLVVGDNNGSFLLDTGVSLNSLLASANATGTVFSRAVAGAAWTSYLASDTNIFDGSPSTTTGTRWALFVYDGVGNFDPTGHKVITTVGAGVTPASITFDGDTLIGTYSINGNIAQQANGTGTHTGLPSVNGSSFNPKGTQGYFGNDFFTFGTANTKIGNAVGVSSRLVFINPSDPDDGTLPVKASYLGQLQASFDGTTLVVAAAVPEPTTYAMLIAGLAAVGFVARRRAS